MIQVMLIIILEEGLALGIKYFLKIRYNDIQVFADYSNSNCVSVFPCNYKDNSGKGKSIFTGDFNNDNSNFRMKDIEVFKVS